MRPVIILGYGGHARVLIDAIEAYAFQSQIDIPILARLDEANEGIVFNHAPETVLLVNGIGSVKSMTLRDKVFRKFTNYKFMTVIHPSAIVSKSAVLGQGSQILAGAVIQPGAIIGENTIVNTRASVDHDSLVNTSCHIAPGVTICGNVSIGHRCHIGTGASIIQGINIADDTLVRAGSIVTRDVKQET